MDPLTRPPSISKFALQVACLLATVLLIRPTQTALNFADHSSQTQTCSFVTRLGEHLQVTLCDGTKVDLNTNSQIRCAFSNNFRNVEVISGEAHFTVNSRDPRPFQVLGGQVVVRDLSTSFDVYRKEGSTLVTVSGGRVKIAAPIGGESRTKFRQGASDIPWKMAPEFQRLQQVEFYEMNGTLRRHPDLDEERLAQLLAWTHGWLDLNGRTLGEAVTEFSRYQPINQFKFEDRALRAKKVGGSMEFTNLADFLAALKADLQVESQISKRSDGVTVVTLSRAR